ncbi:hypothetical protein DICSQDRAFT_172636 [Dichomitus squalens LYAD-421 SS1]|uniref:L-lysine 6-oxidase n=1 Tax=Dichomitus squalens (strain LYAD-421) TaxID=732165 RepID=R7SV16_DICSQ|nr:uncharacterized protein DICSQDRAFT_172636 [Dichomitus squalens LYAD-421 SS1]EJF58812.1 hypothetical protein DICSQDRAFT_172636 [Dichomitus squalens LYAD-421 SS1]
MSTFKPYDPSADKPSANVDPAKIARVAIFPPIGIARVGDSGTQLDGKADEAHPEIEYFYGPEVPGLDEHPFGSFRDSQGRIKRQAARFRVYAYDDQGKVLGEINNAHGYSLTWKVHVANKKAAYFLSRGRLGQVNTDLRNPDVDPVDNASGDPFDLSLESRKRLIIDPGPQVIGGQKGTAPVPLDGKFQGSAREPRPVRLGELRTDDHGRLVFLGGSGHSHSVQVDDNPQFIKQPDIISEFDSVDYYDNMCDGWVEVSVEHPGRPQLAAQIPKPHRATVISAPPKFAWGIESPTSLYDILENIYNKQVKYEEHAGTDFYKDIWPVVSGTYKLSWVNEKAFQGHGPAGFGNFWPQEPQLSSTEIQYKALREHIFGRLREPDYRNKDQAHVIFMPRLSGDRGDALEPGVVPHEVSIQRFAALTALQYERFRDWKDGKFTKGAPFTKKAIEEYDLQEQPIMLTRAILEQSIGDPLYPGIEVYWIAKLAETFDTAVKGIQPPFRVNHDKVLPGFLSRGLSLPWQSDFSQCNTFWWPSARPDDVAVPTMTPWNQSKPNEVRKPAIPTIVADLTQIPRRSWTEGLRVTPDDVSSAFFPGCTDMVRMWTGLGFVVRNDSGPPSLPIWIETERNLPRGYRYAPPPEQTLKLT